jgi:hypothetical protein
MVLTKRTDSFPFFLKYLRSFCTTTTARTHNVLIVLLCLIIDSNISFDSFSFFYLISIPADGAFVEMFLIAIYHTPAVSTFMDLRCFPLAVKAFVVLLDIVSCSTSFAIAISPVPVNIQKIPHFDAVII